jgi:carnitine monooxygenase subunit
MSRTLQFSPWNGPCPAPARARRCKCPYHACTYGLDGRLRAAPRSDREPDFDAEELRLVESGVDTWGPLVFVKPDRGSEPLAAALGDVPVRLAEILDIDSLEFRFRTDFELDVNWKVSCENFLECYHCAVAHPGFSAAVDVSSDAYLLEAQGLVSSQVGPVRRAATGSSPTERCRGASSTSCGRTSA